MSVQLKIKSVPKKEKNMTEQNTGDKRKRHYLSLETKKRMIQDFEIGTRKIDLVKKYDTTFPTVIRILKNSKKIIEQYNTISESGGNNEKLKRYSGTETSPLDICLYNWFKEKRSLGERVTGPLLKQKAIYFSKKINGETSFSASNGWLAGFKNRHGISCLNMEGERYSTNSQHTIPVRKKLNDKEIINKSGGLSLKVHNDISENKFCDESEEESDKKKYKVNNKENDEESDIPSPSKVINALTIVLYWCKTQNREQITLADFSALAKIQSQVLNQYMGKK